VGCPSDYSPVTTIVVHALRAATAGIGPVVTVIVVAVAVVAIIVVGGRLRRR
jgi:hypothetical protein